KVAALGLVESQPPLRCDATRASRLLRVQAQGDDGRGVPKSGTNRRQELERASDLPKSGRKRSGKPPSAVELPLIGTNHERTNVPAASAARPVLEACSRP